MLVRLLPLARDASRRERSALGTAAALLAGIIGVATAHSLLGVGGPELDGPIRDWGSSAVYILVAGMVALRAVRIRQARAPWIAFAAGLSLYGAGNLLWALWLEHVPEPPIPSVSDALWLSLYPCCYVGIGLLAATSTRRAPLSVWLDALVAGLGITAVGSALVFEPVLREATGDALAVVTNLAYPIGDLILAALVLGVLALRGWRPDRAWALLGSGFLVLCVADCLYLLQVAAGTSSSSILANVFYMSGVALIALAAWQPGRVPVSRPAGWSVLLVPAASIAAALALLVYEHVASLGTVPFALAMLTLVAALLRSGLTFRDVRALAQTRQEALTDELTELPNRRGFRLQLEAAITAARSSGGGVALLMVDLDRFKELNDTLGHRAGDLLLREIGPRLEAPLRPTDSVARLGGDEFAVVLSAPASAETALKVSDRLLEAISMPFAVGGLSLQVGASIGVALWPEHGDYAEDILRSADVAMYQAKAMRTGREVYARGRDNHSRDHLALVSDLDTAIRSDALELEFQPIVDVGDRHIVGIEALARWRHPVLGFVAPDVFVPMTEQAGLARMLTRQVLTKAIEQCAIWRDASPELRVSVNVTGQDLHDSALPGEIAAILAERNLPPQALVLEITERSVLSDPDRTGKILARLDEMGVGLSLDDFGTGFSSLTHLKTLPVGEVKVDRSFVARMAVDADDAAIVGATIGLAHSLGMRVVAEGVENDETWQRLAALGCDLIQGFAIARPLPSAELEELLTRRAVAPLPAHSDPQPGGPGSIVYRTKAGQPFSARIH
ncbi:MAG: diguanylate cyclase [Thermoleophilaceae bacterium]|nr:diguanylate cyclase [Thermoleophilaceae bacterium]